MRYEKKEHQLLKILLIGNPESNKSTLLDRYIYDSFFNKQRNTIGVDFKTKEININDQSVKLQIWDTAGQERFKTLTKAYYKGADAIILVYSVTNRKSFEYLLNHWDENNTNAQSNIPVVIAGTRKNESYQNVINTEEIQNIVQKTGAIGCYECALDTGSNINTVFTEAAKAAYQQKTMKSVNEQNNTLNEKPVTQPVDNDQKKKADTQINWSVLAQSFRNLLNSSNQNPTTSASNNETFEDNSFKL